MNVPALDGVLVIDKPVGPTSHDVVARVRRVSGCRRVGHTGTLDPMASGVLPLVLGRATRLSRFLSGVDKTYEATLRLGLETDTYDAEGRARPSGAPGPLPGREVVEGAVRAFLGAFDQVPPPYSAKKIAGTPAYKLARREATVALAPVRVSLHTATVLEFDNDRLRLRLTCSAGFYVRSLAHDLGAALGCGAHLVQLRRTRAGDFALDAAVTLDRLGDPGAVEASLTPLEQLLPGIPAVDLTSLGALRARHGQVLGPEDIAGHAAGERIPFPAVPGPVRLLDPDRRLLGIGEVAALAHGVALHPTVVLV